MTEQRPVVSGVPVLPPGEGSPLDGFSDDTLVEVELGAMREIATMLRDYRERLDKLEKQIACDRCGHEARTRALCGTCHDLPDVDQDVAMTQANLMLRQRILELGASCQGTGDIQQLLALLRANGVKRYRRTPTAGDAEVEIELSPGPKPVRPFAPGLEAWLPEDANRRVVVPADEAAEMERAAQEAGYLDEQGNPTEKLREALYARYGPTVASPLQPDDVEPGGTEGAMAEELSPLPPFKDLKRQSEDLRRQCEADRSGVEVTEVDDG